MIKLLKLIASLALTYLIAAFIGSSILIVVFEYIK